ncbi:MAG: redox-regulated ATPase YchF [Blastocatellia bacterium]|nr:redox-regulated ATPase YchF [Blastocatellia bacterium]
MKVGIVGFAGSGKTTIFNTLTGLRAEVGGYSGKDKANIGIIKVPDARIEALADIFHPKKKTLAEINFVDVAGPEATEERQSSGLDSKLVNNMREVEALVHVIRGFENPALGQACDPSREIANFDSELILTDLISVENRLTRMKKEKANPREKELFEQCKEALEAERPLRDLTFDDEAQQLLSGFRFLSQKPLLLLLNVGEGDISQGAPPAVAQAAAERKLTLITMCGTAEMDIAELAPEEQAEFLQDLGISEAARDRFIRAAYGMLDLISFLTAGEDECRAWTIRRGTKAQKAAGKIHSDLERGFIRAEVVSFPDFMQYKSEAKCKEAGKLRLEGKEYIVQDGDIMHIRFNVS